jgi:hypothetical protein
MTVAELIEKLKACDHGARVVLHDPDTGWFLPLDWGLRKFSYERPEDIPPDAVVVSADYYGS